MTKAGCQILFSSEELLPMCDQIFDHLSAIPRKLYSVENNGPYKSKNYQAEIKSLEQLLKEGQDLPEIEKRHNLDTYNEIAYLLTTSGTSGLQVSCHLLQSS